MESQRGHAASFYEGWVEREIGKMKQTTRYTTSAQPEARIVMDILLQEALRQEVTNAFALSRLTQVNLITWFAEYLFPISFTHLRC